MRLHIRPLCLCILVLGAVASCTSSHSASEGAVQGSGAHLSLDADRFDDGLTLTRSETTLAGSALLQSYWIDFGEDSMIVNIRPEAISDDLALARSKGSTVRQRPAVVDGGIVFWTEQPPVRENGGISLPHLIVVSYFGSDPPELTSVAELLPLLWTDSPPSPTD